MTYFIGMTLPGNEVEVEDLRNSNGWRVMMAMPAIFTLIQSLLLIFIYKYDSPAYYCEINDLKSMKEALSQIYDDEEAIMDKVQLMSTKKKDADISVLAYYY